MQFFIAIFVSYSLRIILSFYDGYSGHTWLGKWFARHWPRWIARDLNILLLLVFVADIDIIWLPLHGLAHWFIHSYMYAVGYFYDGGNFIDALTPSEIGFFSNWKSTFLGASLEYTIHKQSWHVTLMYDIRFFYYTCSVTFSFFRGAEK